MKKIKITRWAIIVISMLAVSCAHKGKPNKQGDLLTTEQIRSLANDQSMNGKLVTVEGYAGFCNENSMMMISVTLGKKNRLTIFSDGYCEGEKLITAEIELSNGSYPLSGEEYRNYIKAGDPISNETLKIMTDDYQELNNTKFKFSGTLIYNGNDYYLNNVTIHK